MPRNGAKIHLWLIQGTKESILSLNKLDLSILYIYISYPNIYHTSWDMSSHLSHLSLCFVLLQNELKDIKIKSAMGCRCKNVSDRWSPSAACQGKWASWHLASERLMILICLSGLHFCIFLHIVTVFSSKSDSETTPGCELHLFCASASSLSLCLGA